MTQPIDYIQLIKFIRSHGDVSLIDAKNIVDAMKAVNLVSIKKGVEIQYPIKTAQGYQNRQEVQTLNLK